MSTPVYKGPGQPTPAASDGLSGWLGGFLGGAAQPAYKTTPTAVTRAPQKPAPAPSGDACVPVPVELDEHGNAVLPVGPGPITIVVTPRA